MDTSVPKLRCSFDEDCRGAYSREMGGIGVSAPAAAALCGAPTLGTDEADAEHEKDDPDQSVRDLRIHAPMISLSRLL
jgi:hypothetical protein